MISVGDVILRWSWTLRKAGNYMCWGPSNLALIIEHKSGYTKFDSITTEKSEQIDIDTHTYEVKKDVYAT